MPESFINKKAKFKNISTQSAWLTEVREILKVNQMAFLCECSERTIRHWQNGKSMMPYQSVVVHAEAATLLFPSVALVDRYEHTKKAGVRGGRAVMEKYGRVPIDEEVRRQRWETWWEQEGKYNMPSQKTKLATLPPRSDELAEFIGIMLGDGGMSAYQLSVTLHSVDDLEYGKFVQKFMYTLFGAKPSVYYRKDAQAHSVVLARKKVVEYLCSLGLVIGNKVDQKIKIPKWILENEKYSLACLRGLMDTDGSVYLHKYKVNNKQYQYKKLCFSSASAPLRKDVQFILHRFGSAATCRGTNVRVDAISDVKRYLEVVGTHNPKHLKRYIK